MEPSLFSISNVLFLNYSRTVHDASFKLPEQKLSLASSLHALVTINKLAVVPSTLKCPVDL